MKAFLFLLLAFPGVLMAQDKELRLDVAGEIAIDHQGAVYDYKINTILTPELKDLVANAVRQWKFEPVTRDGKPVYAKSGMHLTLAALPVADGYQMRVENVRFLGNRQSQTMVPPRYPMNAMKADVGAMVLVAMRVGANGEVLDAAVAQTRLLGMEGSEKAANKWRKLFEEASIDAARHWKFQPADLASGDSPETTLIVPVTYQLEGMAVSQGWREGPSAAKPIPWLPAEKQKYDASGLKQGESIVLDNPVRITTSVVGTTL